MPTSLGRKAAPKPDCERYQVEAAFEARVFVQRRLLHSRPDNLHNVQSAPQDPPNFQQRAHQAEVPPTRDRDGLGRDVDRAKLGANVDTVPLSIQQKATTEKRTAEAGVADRVHVRLLDYRQLPEDFKGRFDSPVGCEMVVAVGLRDLKLGG
ncbi:uncharacterized protein C8Q71DRAFT_344412 [Rhodofomes roseus]|uniref:Uncharacterized protein n=1 Tax=Rhodofomes roseus TaxID=34475 RepID=A0ABQ8KSB4_9APHY|nr:uncharacterized protein C8Q71DRAFT_344412 [Rhodofomes roseus]KAH9841698.1 hypothetical protein C8Q71DRAFT_344412 [Rhodofomes roseus]